MRLASPQLIERLKQLDLCDAGDLRRCHPLVRRLSRDLPAFDSIWVDALVQKRRLTPFQAELVVSDDYQQLNAGPCVLVDRLGHHHTGRTFLARRRGSTDQCVIRFVSPEESQTESIESNLQRLAAAFRDFEHTAVVGPHATLQHADELVTISRHVPGVNLRDTLIQAGRFTAADVIEIGHQILSGLAAMEPHWPTHGDIRIANLRLGTDGRACLVNCGVSVAAEHRFVVHHSLRSDRCDTVAPELIGSNRAPDAQSDLYALGCLLWQLLCGRPPFAFADPLEKLAAHQTQMVPDVRDIAPDTPQWLATAIRCLTNSDRDGRPACFGDAFRVWEQHSGAKSAGANALSRFSPRVREMARRASAPRKGTRWMLLGTAIIAACAVGLTVAGGTSGSRWLSAAWADTPLRNVDRTTVSEKNEPRPLPMADANGVVNLPDAGPWQASLLESPGSITVRGTGSKPAVLVLDEPLVVRAGQLHLENVVLMARSTGVMLECVCQRLRIQRARFEGHRTTACIRWDTPDPRDRGGRSLTITDTEFRGSHTGIEMRRPPADLNLGNVLFTRLQSGLRFTTPLPVGQHANIRMIRVTQRLVTHVLESTLPANGTIPGRVTLWLEDSVFALQGHRAAVFALTGAELPPPSMPIIETRSRRDADPSLLAVGSRVTIWISPQSGLAQEVPSALIAANDLTASPLTFKSVNPTLAVDSELTGFEAPRRSTRNPGVDASTLLR